MNPTPLMQEYFRANESAHIRVATVFSETFEGGLNELGSFLESANGGVGTEVVLVNNDRIAFTNFPNTSGTYNAAFAVAADSDTMWTPSTWPRLG